MSDEDNENGNKVIFLGESNVGKTNLMRISVGKPFDFHSMSTWSVSYLPKILYIIIGPIFSIYGIQ